MPLETDLKIYEKSVNPRFRRVNEIKLSSTISIVFGYFSKMKTFSLSEGKIVGEFKKRIEEAILDGDVENTYDAAYQYMLDIKDEILKTA